MLLHDFPSTFVSSLHEFPETVHKHGGLNCFIEYLHRKSVTANFFSFDIERAKKTFIYWIWILKQEISCSITMYLIITKNDLTFW